ncbi:M48 family metallopeptidase [Balneola sp. MJW-20]|uniref:M48 family metallopeptidase n=1 Tax=Gracilimonas aurantiaca TaxID=3234185 RepID=UPI0034677E54
MMKEIEVSGLKIEFHRDKVKNINLRVYPPSGRIRVSAPWYMRMAIVEEFIRHREKWIREKLRNKRAKQSQQPIEYCEGAKIPFKGRDHVLRLKEKGSVSFEGFNEEDQSLILCDSGTNQVLLENKTEELYRSYLKGKIPEIVSRYEDRMGVKVNEIGVRKMKTRWGSCNIRAGRIWLGLELAKKRPEALEYVVVHEMTHLLEKGHNKRFYGFLDRFYPGWKEIEKELNGRKRFID